MAHSSASPLRPLLRLALVAVTLLALLGGSFGPMVPRAAAADLFVCVRKADGQVFFRSVCDKKNETRVNLYNPTNPVTLNVLTGNGQVFYGRLPKKASAYSLTTPDPTNSLTFCVDPGTLRLSYLGGGVRSVTRCQIAASGG